MFSFLAKLSSVSPVPVPRELDEQLVNPGPLSSIVFTFLVISLLILIFSMNRHIKRINVNRNDESK